MHDKIFEVLLKKELDRIFNKFIDIVDQNVGHSIVFNNDNDIDFIRNMGGIKLVYAKPIILKKVNEIRTDFFKDFFL